MPLRLLSTDFQAAHTSSSASVSPPHRGRRGSTRATEDLCLGTFDGRPKSIGDCRLLLRWHKQSPPTSGHLPRGPDCLGPPERRAAVRMSEDIVPATSSVAPPKAPRA